MNEPNQHNWPPVLLCASSFVLLLLTGAASAAVMAGQDPVTFTAENSESEEVPEKKSYREIRARVQSSPGGDLEEIDMKVHTVPSTVDSVSANDAPLEEDELVLGIVVGGKAMAYPIRYLAMYEIVNDRLGKTPVAPSW